MPSFTPCPPTPNAKILIYNQINPLTPWNLMGLDAR